MNLIHAFPKERLQLPQPLPSQLEKYHISLKKKKKEKEKKILSFPSSALRQIFLCVPL
jgi:hypothetical protein